MHSLTIDRYQDLSLFYGDIHNHCDLSYGQGTLAEAIGNARLQLDFVSITPHAAWPDIPVDDPALGYLVDYHRNGFRKAAANWRSYLAQMDAINTPDEFVAFPSYEWHSNTYGDHCIYYKEGSGAAILDEPDVVSLRAALQRSPSPAMMIPHHIGYQQGYRGINWSAFSEEFSSVVEIMSFHGSSESCDSGVPYLHSMGPCDAGSSAQFGWAQGHVFGVIGSTDGHIAFPGSHGFGRMAVWAPALTRDAIWDAIQQRRTYALTGDRIQLVFALNGHIMGDICPAASERRIEVVVSGGDAIDTIELLHNNQVIHRLAPLPQSAKEGRFKLALQLGWSENANGVPWDVEVEVLDGALLEVEPRFVGYRPADKLENPAYTPPQWSRPAANQVNFQAYTYPNPTPTTSVCDGMAVEIAGDLHTRVTARINGIRYEHSLQELLDGARTHYMGGFVSPAVSFRRAVPAGDYEQQFTFLHRAESKQRDWYTLRVRQRNHQWAWSSPIWVEGN
jgi:hypothetical protein